MVDTCAAEFKAFTPYYYSTFENEIESKDGTNFLKIVMFPIEKIIVLGSGPNRIGRGGYDIVVFME